eukprot:10583478-Heterocapsa_arctica.AAC.1
MYSHRILVVLDGGQRKGLVILDHPLQSSGGFGVFPESFLIPPDVVLEDLAAVIVVTCFPAVATAVSVVSSQSVYVSHVSYTVQATVVDLKFWRSGCVFPLWRSYRWGGCKMGVMVDYP